MASVTLPRATLADLYRTPGKAELIRGRIVHLMPTGRKPNRAAFRIARSLDDYAHKRGAGEAFTDNMGYVAPPLPSGRESFSPDASYHEGPFPADEMRFIEAAPTFAADVRSANDYGPTAELEMAELEMAELEMAELEMAEKRADYFAAGTQVVWDVDPKAEVIYSYPTTLNPPFSGADNSRMPNRRFPVGALRSTGSSLKAATYLGLAVFGGRYFSHTLRGPGRPCQGADRP